MQTAAAGRLVSGRSGPRVALLVVCGLTTLLGAGAWSDFHFYATGARQLTGPHGFAIYADHPEIQIGPVALLLIRGLLAAGEQAAKLTTQIIATALALVPLIVCQRVQPNRRGLHWAVALAIGLTWTQISVHAQPADAVTVALLCVAVACVVDGRASLAVVAVVLAAGAKPWAAPAAALLLGLPTLRTRLVALGSATAAVAAIYLPFLLQPGAGSAVRPHILVQPDAPVAWVVHAWHPAPTALRPIQLLVCAAVAALLGLRGRWRTVPAAVIAIRLLLDPGALPYYHAGLVAACGLVGRRAGTALALALGWFIAASSLYGLGIGAFSRTLQLGFGAALLATLWSRS